MKPKLIPFFERHNIPYEMEGKNVKKGNLTIKCPFCKDDPGFHLGVNLEDGAYSCWRDSRHRGRNTVKLVMVLIHCTVEQAKQELGYDTLNFDLQREMIKDEIERMFGVSKITVVAQGGVDHLEFDKEFHPIDDKGTKVRFFNYLDERGFDYPEDIVREYNLKAASTGDFKDRVIIPVYMEGKLVTWTSRSIHKKAIPKYKDLAIEKSVRHCKYCLGNYDKVLLGGRVLFVTEGPLDMLKMDFYSSEEFRATCLFTRFITPEQSLLLMGVASLYRDIVLLLDDDAQFIAMKMSDSLSYISNLKVGTLPPGVHDPGEMSEKAIMSFLEYNYY